MHTASMSARPADGALRRCPERSPPTWSRTTAPASLTAGPAQARPQPPAGDTVVLRRTGSGGRGDRFLQSSEALWVGMPTQLQQKDPAQKGGLLGRHSRGPGRRDESWPSAEHPRKERQVGQRKDGLWGQRAYHQGRRHPLLQQSATCPAQSSACIGERLAPKPHASGFEMTLGQQK